MKTTKNDWKAAADHEAKLRSTLREVDPRRYEAIRSAYYKAIEGLIALADELERAAPDDDEEHPLLYAHFTAAYAHEVLDGSQLGRIV